MKAAGDSGGPLTRDDVLVVLLGLGAMSAVLLAWASGT